MKEVSTWNLFLPRVADIWTSTTDNLFPLKRRHVHPCSPNELQAAVSWLPARLPPIWVTCVRSFSPLFCYAVPVFVCLPLSSFLLLLLGYCCPYPSLHPPAHPQRGAICREDKMKRISFHSPLLSLSGVYRFGRISPDQKPHGMVGGDRGGTKEAEKCGRHNLKASYFLGVETNRARESSR